MNKQKIQNVNIAVVGSSNTDMVIKVKNMPDQGETVLGGSFLMNQGGKGANQAVAAARLGGNVGLIARVGNDIFGKQAIKSFKKEGIEVNHIDLDPEEATGIATITVDDSGQNSIVVAPGANSKLLPEHIFKATKILESSKVILLQLEIKLETVYYAARMGFKLQKKVILNPAPFTALSKDLYPHLYAITPNQIEAEGLTGVKIKTNGDAENAAVTLKNMGVENIIITLGAAGAFVLSDEFTGAVPGQLVKSVDTTAAGDTFNGALAVAIAGGSGIREAVEFANRAAAISVTRRGAQQSCPTLKDLNEVKFDHF